MIIRYDSIAALCDAYIAIGGAKTNPFVAKGYTGDISLVSEAEEQIAQIEQEIETPRMGWERSPAGAFCIVPEMLAGLPTPMRRRTYIPNQYAPITIIVGTASSAGIRSDIFKRRGVTIVALVMALARVRPISLYIMDPGYGPPEHNNETVIMAKVNTTPFDLATACYVLTEQRFTTLVAYGIEENITGRISWPPFYGINPTAYYDGLYDRMSLSRRDTLIIKDAYLDNDIIAQPIKWLNKQIERFTTNQEAETP